MRNLRFGCLLLAIVFSLWTCGQGVDSTAADELPLSEDERYRATCGNCHALPSPQDLPRAVWAEVVLPRMGQFLGHYTSPNQREQLLAEDPLARARLEAASIYPAQPTVSAKDWAAVQTYVLQRAPDTLIMPSYPVGSAAALQVSYPNFFLSPPSSTYVAVAPEGGVLLADINKASLFRLDAQLSPKQQIKVGAGLTDICTGRDGTFATVIGSFSPTDVGMGSVLHFGSTGPVTVASGLRRPTSLIALNLDADPEEELLVTEFGKWTGGLSRWDRQADGSYARTDISSQTGAMQILAMSGLAPTFLVLYAQGQEQVVKYTLDDKDNVQSETVLRFPPSYGSSSLKLVDWNADAVPDLLYTCGDAADYISQPKPYHGVRLYVGKANGQYVEEKFWPLPGAYDAELGDFDSDGDADLAAVSFFPDFRQSNPASAVIFDNDGSAQWPLRPLAGADRGRFIRLAAGDIDGDGKSDLVASTLAMEPVPDRGRLASWIEQGIPFVVWKGQ